MDDAFYYKMVIQYDGTPFSGWQVQPNGVSIQQKIQDAIFIITKETVNVTGSGRTDAGVHALGQTAHFHTNKSLNLYAFQNSLNALLPPQIRIKEIVPTVSTFHARYSAVKKTYRYNITLTPYQNPFNRLYTWHLRDKIDLDLFKEAAQQLLGTHDFTSFANEAHTGSASKDPVRTLMQLSINESDDGIYLELEADGFLYKMVRNIVGTLVDIAAGRLTSSIPEILAAKDRRQAGTTAPAQGLFLWKVDY